MPAATNAPAPPRSFGWLAGQCQRWLGIADQRHDYDALVTTLECRDRDIVAQQREIEEITARLQDFYARLGWYEAIVPALAKAKITHEAAQARQAKHQQNGMAGRGQPPE